MTEEEPDSEAPNRPDLSVVIPAANEGPNLALLLPRLNETLDPLGIAWEVLVVVRDEDEATVAAARAGRATLLRQETPGYGGALRTGFARAAGDWLLTMDADLSHPPVVAANLWRARHSAAVLIASRYVRGGAARMPLGRLLLSRLLNAVFATALGLPVKDLSSGFRLYRREVVAETAAATTATATNFAILQELLVHAAATGWSIAEIPFAYAPRRHGSSNARVVAFGLEYAASLRRLRALRAAPRRAADARRDCGDSGEAEGGGCPAPATVRPVYPPLSGEGPCRRR
ncbi:MAG: glycosyltransferase [Chloroflexia bacterium]|nr:glycosyltransferase [Chloroflexia bacterium]